MEPDEATDFANIKITKALSQEANAKLLPPKLLTLVNLRRALSISEATALQAQSAVVSSANIYQQDAAPARVVGLLSPRVMAAARRSSTRARVPVTVAKQSEASASADEDDWAGSSCASTGTASASHNNEEEEDDEPSRRGSMPTPLTPRVKAAVKAAKARASRTRAVLLGAGARAGVTKLELGQRY
jgi:hypothetical protein